MKIGITGASGFIGRHLIKALQARGHESVAFLRSPRSPAPEGAQSRPFPPDQAPDLRGLDAVVNLAGETIVGRWTAAKKQRIVESRLRTTERLVEARARLSAADGPRVFVSASAIGYYGDRGEEISDEDTPAGTEFLAEVSRRWEEAALHAEQTNTRVALLRIGFVLGRDGGSFPPLRRAFKLGLGGKLGDGRQWMSLVHVEDVVGLILFLLENESARGPFNAVCPQPARNADFTRAVGRALHRPTILPAPGWVLRGALGELSHLLLDSQRVLPKRTLAAGYAFRFPTLESMLADLSA